MEFVNESFKYFPEIVTTFCQACHLSHTEFIGAGISQEK